VRITAVTIVCRKKYFEVFFYGHIGHGFEEELIAEKNIKATITTLLQPTYNNTVVQKEDLFPNQEFFLGLNLLYISCLTI
jgi:hypothetical protein